MSNKHIKTKYGNASISGDGYYRITSEKEGNFGKLLHRLIIEDYYNIILPKDWVVHHHDGNKLNNNLNNLIPMPLTDHLSFHSSNISDETRKKRSLSKMGSKNPNYNKKYSEKEKKIKSETMKIWASEEHQKKVFEGLKKVWDSKEKSKRKSSVHNDNWKDLTYKEQLTKISRELNMGLNNPQASKGNTGFLRVVKNPCKSCKQGFTWRYRYTLENGKRISFVKTDLMKLKEVVLEKGYEWVITDDDKASKSIAENNKWHKK